MKKILSIVLAVLMVFALTACSNEAAQNAPEVEELKKQKPAAETDFAIEEIEGGVKVVAYNGKEEAIVIPESINEKTVLEIESYFFSNESPVKAVLIPKTVKTLKETFAHNTNIETIICEGVEEIGIASFYGCTNLKNVILGEELEIIGEMAFYNCSSLEKLVFVSDPHNFSGGSLIFAGCEKLTLYGSDGGAVCVFAENYDLKFKTIKN